MHNFWCEFNDEAIIYASYLNNCQLPSSVLEFLPPCIRQLGALPLYLRSLGPRFRQPRPQGQHRRVSNPDEAAAAVATLKRRLANVSGKLEEALQPQSKQSVCVLQLYIWPHHLYFSSTPKTIGRGIRKLVWLFDDASAILDDVAIRTLIGHGTEEPQPEVHHQYVL